MTVTVTQPNVVIQRNIIVNADGTQTPQIDADMLVSGTATNTGNIKVRVVRNSDNTVLKDWTIFAVTNDAWGGVLPGISLDAKNKAKIEVEDINDSGQTDSKTEFYFGIVEVRSGQSNSSYWRSSTESPAVSIATAFYSDYSQSEGEGPQPVPAATPVGDGARSEAKELDDRWSLPIWVIAVAAGSYNLERLRGTIIGTHGQIYIDGVVNTLSSLENGCEFIYLPVTVWDAIDGVVFGTSFTSITGEEWSVEALDLCAWYLSLMGLELGDCIIVTATLGTTSPTYRSDNKITDAAAKSLREGAWYFEDLAPYIHYASPTQQFSNVDGVHWGEDGDAVNYKLIASLVINCAAFFSGNLDGVASASCAARPSTVTISGSAVTLAYESLQGGISSPGTPDGFTAYNLFGDVLAVSSVVLSSPNITFTVSGAGFTSGDDILVGYLEDLDAGPSVILRGLGTFTQTLGTRGLLSTEFVPPLAPTDNDLDSNFFRQFAGKKR